MGKALNPNMIVPGRRGDYVTYQRLGQWVTRFAGKPERRTNGQLANEMSMTVTNTLLSPLKDFIKISLKNSPKKKKTWSLYNLAVSLNKPGAITGRFPEIEVDYSKAIFAVGVIPVPVNHQVSIADSVVSFTWEADLQTAGCDPTDQVMCIILFPEISQGMTVLHGALRAEEKQRIVLPTFTGKLHMETYLCFISGDRESVSNSVYTGQLVWDKQ